MSDMSEREIENVFREIVEAGEHYDVGIDLFNQEIMRAEAEVAKAKTGDAVYDALAQLNDDWQNYGSIATLTGRIYIVEEGLVPPKSWGDILVDEEDESYYFVEQEQLRSIGIAEGIHVQPTSDAEASETGASRLAYGFISTDSKDEGYPTFMAYPDELIEHWYDTPTPAAANMRLHRDWPEHMELINNLVQPGTAEIGKLPRRLAMLTQRIGTNFENALMFWNLAAIYINDRLHLDEERPYMVRVKDGIACKDSDDFVNIAIDGDITLNGHYPWVYFEWDQDSLRPLLQLMVPDDDDGGTAEVAIPLHNILRIKGAPSVQTLIQQALWNMREELPLEFAADADFTAPNIAPMRIDRPNHHHGGDPVEIEAMKLLERDLVDLIGEVQTMTRESYTDEATAAQKSWRLTQAIGMRLAGAGIEQFALEFSGEKAQRPRFIRELPDGQELEQGMYVVRLDAKQPFTSLQHGDSFYGTFYSVFNDVEEIEDDEIGETFYRPFPVLIANVDSQTTALLTRRNVPLVENELRRRAIIPLDGSVQISIIALENYRQGVKARMQAAQQYARDPIVDEINRLYGAFKQETDDGFQDMKDISRLTSIAERIVTGNLRGGSGAALTALETMLIHRAVVIRANLYDSDGTGHADDTVAGMIIDVRADIPGLDIRGPFAVVVGNGGRYRYVHLPSVTSFAF
ncbi:MAG: hypothetical protein ACSLEY_00985 [Candidatus Saccharimonadales bacterium]